MGYDIRTFTASGRLTKDPASRSAGTSTVVFFGLAVGHGKGQDDTTFWDVEVWGKSGQFVLDYLRKGSRVVVSGNAQIEKWQGRDGSMKSSAIIKDAEVVSMESRSSNQAGAYPSNSGFPTNHSVRHQQQEVDDFPRFPADVPPPGDDEVPF